MQMRKTRSLKEQRERIEEQRMQYVDVVRYQRARVFIETLHKHGNKMTLQEYREIKKLALDGNMEVARKRLEIILSDREL